MKKIICPIFSYSKKSPDSTALLTKEKKISYKKLNQIVDDISMKLRHIGVKKGERVLVKSENSLEFIAIIFALFRINAVVCPLNFKFPESKIKNIAKKIKAGYLLFSKNEKTDIPDIPSYGFSDIFKGRSSKNEEKLPELYLEQDATIVLTSGSSGEEKAALHTLKNHYYSALGSNENIKLLKNDIWLLSLPLFHVGGLAILFRVFLSGASIFLPESNKSFKKSILEFGITHVSFVESQLSDLLDTVKKNKKKIYWKLKAVLTGGGPLDKKLLSEAVDLKIPVYSTYGMTEMSSQITTSPEPLKGRDLGHSGKILSYRNLKIDKFGEILVRGETLFSGYLHEGKIKKKYDNIWFPTGDIGETDERGYLYIKGRSDNMFISGGENIYPEEIEAELLKMENIITATVIPVKDNRFGSRPVSFLETNNNFHNTKKELIGILKKSLPSFKIPDRFFICSKHKFSGLKKDRTILKKMFDEKKHLKEIL